VAATPLGLRAGVWTFSAELTGGGQPAGLAEGSRWSFRAKGERPPEDRVGWSSTPAGCQSLGDVTAATWRVPTRFSGATPISSRLGSDESGTPSGVQGFSCAVARRSPAPKKPRRPPATLWQPCGLTDPECPNSRPQPRWGWGLVAQFTQGSSSSGSKALPSPLRHHSQTIKSFCIRPNNI
jgi:hypothetical protein